MRASLASGLLLAICQVVFAQNKGHFINPPESSSDAHFDGDAVYTVGQTLAVRWSMSLDAYVVSLWQQSLTLGTAAIGPSIYTRLAGGPEPGGFNWTVTKEKFDLAQSSVFFLSIDAVPGSITSNSVTSHYFNLTEGNNAQSTSTVSSSNTVAPSSTTVVSTSSATTVSSPGISMTTATPSNGPSNSTVLKISLGISIGLGVPLLALAIYMAMVLGRKPKKSSPPHSKRLSTLASDLRFKSNAPTSPQEMALSHGLHTLAAIMI